MSGAETHLIMDLQSFIQSGLLEAYTLGQCTAEERALVERMIAQHAEVRAELASIEKALEGYASANAVQPPAWMKGRILEVIENEANVSAPPPPSTTPGSRPGFLPLRLYQLLALSFALLALFFFFQKNNLAAEKTSLENRVADLQKQTDDCKQRDSLRTKLEQVNLLLRDRENTRTVPLGKVSGEAGVAYAYLNARRCEVAIDLGTLPAPAPGKHYQFWSIVDGKPVSMGMVALQSAGGWQAIPCRENAVALAVSLEDNPLGNPAPTEVFMIGNIPAS